MTIIILEGPDCGGKSTLAATLADKYGYFVQHLSYNKSMDVKKEHYQALNFALGRKSQNTVLDRHAISELVYSTVFRNGPSYDIFEMFQKYVLHNVVVVYCNPGKEVMLEEFAKRKSEEMFESNSEIIDAYEIVMDRLSLSFAFNIINYNWRVDSPTKAVLSSNAPIVGLK